MVVKGWQNMTQMDDCSQCNLCKVISSLKRQMWVQTITQVFADKPLIEEIQNGFCNSGVGVFFNFFLFIPLRCIRWNSCNAIILLSCDNCNINLVVPSKVLAFLVFMEKLTFFFFSVSRDEAYRNCALLRRNRTCLARRDMCFTLARGRAKQVQCQGS